MRWIKIVLIGLLLVVTGCENNIIISYNPELLDTIKFVKFEKRSDTGVAICDGADPDHLSLHFIVTGDQGSPITPTHSLLGRFGEEVEKVELLTLDEEDDGAVSLVNEGKLTFEANGVATTRQDLHFLIDLTKNIGATPAADNDSPRSGGVTSGEIDLLTNSLDTALKNSRKLYNDSKTSFPADPFGVQLSAFTGDAVGPGLKLLLKDEYVTDHTVIEEYFQRDSGNDKNYLTVYETAITYHRKFYDGLYRLLEVMGGDSGNQNVVLLTNGYDELFYDEDLFPAETPSAGIEAGTTSSRSEADLVTLATDTKIPLFIAANRSNQKSFGIKYIATVDQKLKNLACITNGIYFDTYLDQERCRKGQETQCFQSIDYSNIDTHMIGRLTHAIFGTWRLDIKYSGTGEHIGMVRITYRDGNQELNTEDMIYKVIQ